MIHYIINLIRHDKVRSGWIEHERSIKVHMLNIDVRVTHGAVHVLSTLSSYPWYPQLIRVQLHLHVICWAQAALDVRGTYGLSQYTLWMP